MGSLIIIQVDATPNSPRMPPSPSGLQRGRVRKATVSPRKTNGSPVGDGRAFS
jgi:hypothetical protein